MTTIEEAPQKEGTQEGVPVSVELSLSPSRLYCTVTEKLAGTETLPLVAVKLTV